MAELKALIAQVATGAALSREEAAEAFASMMSGEATPSQMGGLLMALRVRGETVEEITGAVTAMRAKMLRVEAPPQAIDVVGTGGDASGSYNISTCAASSSARTSHRTVCRSWSAPAAPAAASQSLAAWRRRRRDSTSPLSRSPASAARRATSASTRAAT